jgi:hypothetical protein
MLPLQLGPDTVLYSAGLNAWLQPVSLQQLLPVVLQEHLWLVCWLLSLLLAFGPPHARLPKLLHQLVLQELLFAAAKSL